MELYGKKARYFIYNSDSLVFNSSYKSTGPSHQYFVLSDEKLSPD